jgi:DNA-binding MarR family transcriptional regulator
MIHSLPAVFQFMQELWAVVHGLDKTSKRMLREIGVTAPQRLVLRVIGASPGTSAGEVAMTLHTHKSTLTGVLQRLVERGLVVRVPDSRDRRRVVLRLTASGERIDATREGTVEAAVVHALRGVSDQKRAIVAAVLRRLATELGAPTSRGFAARPAARDCAR